jgi:hypothetical protein
MPELLAERLNVGRDKGFGATYEDPYPVVFSGLLRLGGEWRGQETEGHRADERTAIH